MAEAVGGDPPLEEEKDMSNDAIVKAAVAAPALVIGTALAVCGTFSRGGDR